MEETIAALHEELEFTTNFAYSMVRESNYHAAAEVIEEQRRSLVRASDRIERVLREPEIRRAKMRTRVALAGVAATLALASGAFATFGPGATPPAQARIRAIQEATEALDAAVAISNPIALSAIVAPQQERILAAAQSAATDPEMKAALLDSVQKLQKVISNPALPAQVRARAQEVADTVQQIVVEVPETVADQEKDSVESTESTEPTDSTPSAPTP